MMREESSNFTECYVAFLDILGMKDLVNNCAANIEKYQKVTEALVEAKDLSPFRKDSNLVIVGIVKGWQLQVHAFSDCICLFIPVESEMLPWLLASIRRLHDRMIRLEVLLRGAVTIGGMHWETPWSVHDKDQIVGATDEETKRLRTPVAFGPGLIAAHKLESRCAIYPRILISDALFDQIEKTKQLATPLAKTGQLLQYVRQDYDGLHHLDVLHPNIHREDVLKIETSKFDAPGVSRVTMNLVTDQTSYPERLKAIGNFIADNLDKLTHECLLAKYQWLARYFNEKAREAGLKTIHIFESDIPANVPKLTLTNRGKQQNEDGSG